MSLVEPFKLARLDRATIDEMLARLATCRVAFNTGSHPYIAPFQHVLIDGTMYLNFSAYGRKIEYIQQDSRVCIEIEDNAPDMSTYAFVVLRGRLAIVEDPGERASALEALARRGKERFSPAFTAAHGIRDGKWEDLAGDPAPSIVVKLVDVVECMGLGSPGVGRGGGERAP